LSTITIFLNTLHFLNIHYISSRHCRFCCQN